MPTIYPTLAHELAEYDTWRPEDTATTADLSGDDEPATCEATVARTGEPCGRDLPCPYHDD